MAARVGLPQRGRGLNAAALAEIGRLELQPPGGAADTRRAGRPGPPSVISVVGDERRVGLGMFCEIGSLCAGLLSDGATAVLDESPQVAPGLNQIDAEAEDVRLDGESQA